jgi:uncharacterized protein (TIGR02569 family)
MPGMTDLDSTNASPNRTVLEAFGLTGRPVALPGGEGRSVLVGDAVLKPVDDVEEAEWCAQLLDRVEGEGFRVPRPLRARDGSFVAFGWSATARVDGVSDPAADWAGVLEAGRAFHQALQGEPCPPFLERRDHRWALGDRVAWGEDRGEPLAPVAGLFHALCSLLRPVHAVNQVIHGDLSGNVLAAPGVPPAVIDFSPYWRPTAYADAIVAVDALLWYGAGPDLVALAGKGADFPQMLVRALVFRLVALNEKARTFGRECLDGELELFVPVVAYARELVEVGLP